MAKTMIFNEFQTTMIRHTLELVDLSRDCRIQARIKENSFLSGFDDSSTSNAAIIEDLRHAQKLRETAYKYLTQATENLQGISGVQESYDVSEFLFKAIEILKRQASYQYLRQRALDEKLTIMKRLNREIENIVLQ